MKTNLLFLLMFGYSSICFSQKYDVSAGLRVGTEWGLTSQFRITEQETIEGIIQQSFGKNQTMFSALYEHHQQFIGKRFNVYKGGGFHFGGIGENSKLENPKNPVGITGIAGIEATFARYTISYDIKPAINLNGGGYNTVDFQTGISVRYVIEKRKTPIFKRKKKKNAQKLGRCLMIFLNEKINRLTIYKLAWQNRWQLNWHQHV